MRRNFPSRFLYAAGAAHSTGVLRLLSAGHWDLDSLWKPDPVGGSGERGRVRLQLLLHFFAPGFG